MAKGASMKAKPVSKCRMPRCTNSATSPRAKFCTECFKKNAKLASLKRKVWAGNKKKGKVKKNAGKRNGLRRSSQAENMGDPWKLDVKTRLDSIR